MWRPAKLVLVKEQAITQPVTTPAVLSVSLIRETLNPRPSLDAPVGVWRDHGYMDAMLDAALADVAYDEDDLLELQQVINAVLRYDDCEWQTIEWWEQAVEQLEELAEKAYFKALDS